MMTTGDTTADAPRPLFGSAENAIPRTVAVAVPYTVSEMKRNHL